MTRRTRRNHARTCPADLSAISGQVQSPDIQALLTTTIDSIVAENGGLDPAVAATTAKLAQMRVRARHRRCVLQGP